MPKSSEREYRSMAAMTAVRDAEGAEAPAYRVQGYATTFNEPYLLYECGGEQFFEEIAADAFDGCDMTDVILQYDHCGMVYARNRNGSLELSIDDHGLLVTGDLSLTEQSRQLWEAINTGLIDRMSFAFTVTGHEYNEATHTDRITHIGKLYDVSAVSVPANPGTEISSARKALLDGEIQKKQAERLAAERRAKHIKLLRLRLKLEETDNV